MKFRILLTSPALPLLALATDGPAPSSAIDRMLTLAD